MDITVNGNTLTISGSIGAQPAVNLNIVDSSMNNVPGYPKTVNGPGQVSHTTPSLPTGHYRVIAMTTRSYEVQEVDV